MASSSSLASAVHAAAAGGGQNFDLSEEEQKMAMLAQTLGDCVCCHHKHSAPRLLHCMHVACYKCLAALVQGNCVTCPKCHFESVLGPEGLADASLVVPEIVEVVREGRNVCEECLKERASVHCFKCDAPLCRPCYELTHASRLFRSHKIQEIDDGRPTRQEPRCEIHPEERIKFVCTSDQALLCRDCILMGGYKDQAYISVKEAGAQARALVSFLIERARDRMAAVSEAEHAVADIVPQLDREYNDLVVRVKTRGERMQEAIIGRRDMLLKEANELKELKVARLMDQNDRLMIVLGAIENACAVYKAVYDMSSDFECLEIMGEVERNLSAMTSVQLPQHPIAESGSLAHLDDVQLETGISQQRDKEHAEAVRNEVVDADAHVFAVGGNDGKSDLSTVEIYEPTSDSWSHVPPMAVPRRGPACAAVNGMLFVVGGWDGSQHLDSMEAFEPSRQAWLPMPPMGTRRNGLALAALNGKLYACGGYDGKHNLETVERFDAYTNQWARVASMKTARRGCVAAVLHNKLYVLGGYDGSRHHTSVERYDPYGNSWVPIASMFTPRRMAAAAVVAGKLYVIGGIDGARALESVERYDAFTDSWTEVSPMQHKRQGAAAVAFNGKIYVMGGWDGLALNRLDSVEKFDPSTDTWTTVTSMHAPRFALTASPL